MISIRCLSLDPAVDFVNMLGTRESGISVTLFLSAFLFTLLPCLLYIHRLGLYAPFSFFANDAFYYLDVARNSQGMPFFTFDGVHPTNGFHPLWQFLLYLGVKTRYFDLRDPAHALRRLFVTNLVILSFAVSNLALVCARLLKHKWLALLTVCPGWTWFLVALGAPNYLAGWSFCNGMETSLELLFFGCALLCDRPSAHPARWMPIMAFFMGLTVLSRLDDIFFLLPILAFFSLGERRGGGVLSPLIPVAMIGSYLIYNLHSVGMMMPISGSSKAGLAVRENFLASLKVFLPVRWDTPAAETHLGYSVFAEAFMRSFQMVFPVVICGIYLSKRKRENFRLVEVLCVGVVLKGLYNFAFVALWNQGHWYYGASVFVCNLILALSIDRALNTASGNYPDGTSTRWTWAGMGASVAVILFSFNAFVNNKLSTGFGYHAQEVFKNRGGIVAMLRSSGVDKFIELDDGKLGFATGMESLSGIGLVLDREGMAARRQGRFFALARERGYHFILTDPSYADSLEEAAAHSQQGLWGIHESEFNDFSVTLIAVDGKTGVRLYHLEQLRTQPSH